MSATVTVTTERIKTAKGTGSRAAQINALAWSEARRLLKHPALLAGAALAMVFLTVAITGFRGEGMDEQTAPYMFLTGYGLLPLSAGCFLAANLMGLRRRLDRTDDLVGSAPTPPGRRTASMLLAVVPVAMAGALLIGATALIVRARGGLRVITTTGAVDVMPHVLELLQGPLVVIFFGVLGIALARVIPHPAVSMFLMVGFLPQMVLVAWMTDGVLPRFAPLTHSVKASTWVEVSPTYGYPLVDGFDVGAMGWHLVYLLGLITVVSVTALLGRIRSSVAASAVALGVTAAVIGGWMQASWWSA